MVKGGAGSDTFVIKENYYVAIRDFNVNEDRLDMSGMKGSLLDWEHANNSTYIFNRNDDLVAIFRKKIDLDAAEII